MGYGWGASRARGLFVSGCNDKTVGDIVRGFFSLATQKNHGKPVYQKVACADGVDVMLYYWDDRDGVTFSGWYFAPKVGGEEVWGFCPAQDSPTPPLSGWRVPCHGEVDLTLKISPQGRSPSSSSSSGRKKSHKKVKTCARVKSASDLPERKRKKHKRKRRKSRRSSCSSEDDLKSRQKRHQLEHLQHYQAQQLQQQQRQEYQVQQLQNYHQLQNYAQWQQLQAAQAAEVARHQQEQDKRSRDDGGMQGKRLKRVREPDPREGNYGKPTDDRKQQLELARKQMEMENQAALTIMKKIQELRVATPATFEIIKMELQDVVDNELEKTGTQKARVHEEVERALESTSKSMKSIVSQQRKLEEQRKAEEQAAQDKENSASALLGELRHLLQEGEVRLRVLKESFGLLYTHSDMPSPMQGLQDDNGMGEEFNVAVRGAGNQDVTGTQDDLESRANRIDEACRLANTTSEQLKVFMVDRSAEVHHTQTTPRVKSSELKECLAKVLQTAAELKIQAQLLCVRGQELRGRLGRRASAINATHAMLDIFERYDQDTDSVLSRREVLCYAEGEFGCVLSPANVEKIWRTLVEDGSRGVTFERFHDLKVAVGVARELERDERRLQQRRIREKAHDVLRAGVVARVQEVVDDADGVEQGLRSLETKVGSLQVQVKKMVPSEITVLADTTDEQIQALRKQLLELRASLESISERSEDIDKKADIVAIRIVESKAIELRLGRMEQRLNRATNLSARFRAQAERKLKSGVQVSFHGSLMEEDFEADYGDPDEAHGHS